ncbi:MAG: hypothetical protein II999_02830 [Bacteroidaceae bacterium]|nr:hypothetical protein [Bacteroidaceae bacterium]
MSLLIALPLFCHSFGSRLQPAWQDATGGLAGHYKWLGRMLQVAWQSSVNSVAE